MEVGNHDKFEEESQLLATEASRKQKKNIIQELIQKKDLLINIPSNRRFRFPEDVLQELFVIFIQLKKLQPC